MKAQSALSALPALLLVEDAGAEAAHLESVRSHLG